MENTTVIELSYEHVQQGYATIPALQQFGRIMAEYLFMMLDAHSTHRISSTAEQRYQRMMEDHPAILQRVPQYIIASHIGVTPEALSRIRKRMMARV
jgi:CRP-like cAMP-binding protein